MVIRMVMFYAVSSLIRNFMGGQKSMSPVSNSPTDGSRTLPPSLNMFNSNEMFNMQMYLSPLVSQFYIKN